MPLYRHGLAWALAALLLAACTGAPPVGDRSDGGTAQGGDAPDAVPKLEPRSRYGNPPFYEVAGRRYDVLASSDGFVERGIASWYGSPFHGRRASSGETYDMYAMTAAHPTLPLPTYVQVTNLENGRKAVVRVNDRGPFHDNRVIDLSYAAAGKLGVLQKGTAMVELRALDPRGSSGPSSESSDAVTSGFVVTDAPNLYLQVGAFSDAGNAEQLRAQLTLRQLGDIHIQPADAETPLYRVRIGPLPSVLDADLLAQRLEAVGVRDFRVIIE
jgi:rare lipoprotein A